MESTHELETDALQRLLAEMGLSDEENAGAALEDAGVDFFLRIRRREPDVVEALDDGKEARILQQTRSWLRFLDGQAEHLTDVAARVYDRLATAGELLDDSLGASNEAKDDIIDRLEWVLATVECWIEEKRPDDDNARFVIAWTNDDGNCAWKTGSVISTERVSIKAVVRDSAETEGEFPAEDARRIADRVVAGLRSGEVQLPRLRPVKHESRGDESVFELVPRGEDYKAAVAAAEESATAIPSEVEACLGSKNAAVLAQLIDSVAYELAEARLGNAINLPSSFSERSCTRFSDLVDRVAKFCPVSRRDVVRCLFSVANDRLDISRLAGNHAAVIHYGSVLNSLAPLVLNEAATP